MKQPHTVQSNITQHHPHTHNAECTHTHSQTPLLPEQSEPLSRNESELAFLCGGKDSKWTIKVRNPLGDWYLYGSQKRVNTQDRCLLGPNNILVLTHTHWHITWYLMHVRLATNILQHAQTHDPSLSVTYILTHHPTYRHNIKLKCHLKTQTETIIHF